ncbi:hypothetical protein [Streptomyces hydrogenans]|uniref:hypothetical protein n=1 Tax=Streptomyces hydrogenans TaxID=1873719 RepID=UPI0035DFF6F6
MDVWNYFEGKPEFLTALVAGGALFFTLVGAKIQANAGRAQAAAARQAAEIAAKAQREAALWTVRQVQVAELLRSINRLHQKCNELWKSENEELAAQVGEISEETSLLWHEVRLVVTKDVAGAAGKLLNAVANFEATTRQYAPVLHARQALDRFTFDGDQRGSAIARILEHGEESDRTQSVRAFSDLVPQLTDSQIHYLLANHGDSDDHIRHLRASAKREYRRALIGLVHEARTMLGSEEEASPVVMRQRRWWRRNSAATSTSSA